MHKRSLWAVVKDALIGRIRQEKQNRKNAASSNVLPMSTSQSEYDAEVTLRDLPEGIVPDFSGRDMSAKLSSATVGELHDQWHAALRSAGFPGDVAEQYSTILANEFVSIEQGSSLEEMHFQEMGIKIGYRKDVRRAAVLARREAEIKEAERSRVGEVTPKTSALEETAGADGVARDGEQYFYDDGEQHDPAEVEDDSMITKERSNNVGVLWKAVSGGSRTLAEFLAKMCSIRKRAHFPKSFDRAFLDNKPMPFHDQDGVHTLIVLRIPDLENEEGTTVGTITNRLVIMFSTNFKRVMTYHRCDRDPLERMAKDWDKGTYDMSNLFQVIDAINRCYLLTFRQGLRQLQARSDELEDEQDMVSMVEGLTHVQKKAAVYKRCLSAGRQALEELKELRGLEDYIPLICETAQSFESMMDEVAENAVGTINMQMALDGFHSSRNTQVFTYISVVCQPITVATGWYGMNYVNMPELENDNGYFIFAGVTITVALMLLLASVYLMEWKKKLQSKDA